MEYFIGLDLGTSVIKGILVSLEGEQSAQAKQNTEFLYPAEGYVEYDPVHHYESVCKVIKTLVSSVSDLSEVKAISMSAASGNTLLLKDGKPLTNIISWMDSRAIDQAFPGLDTGEVHGTVGWPWLNGLFPFSHLLWLKTHKPDVFNQADRFCMNNDWLTYQLTGKWVVDSSTATTFYLQNQTEGQWYEPYLDLLDISVNELSVICRPGDVVGSITEKASVETGLPVGTQVVLGSFDHPSAARGTGVTSPGDLLLSCGTSWVGFYPVEHRDDGIRQQLLVDPFLSPDGPWGVMFALSRIDLLVNWFLDNLIFSRSQQKKDFAFFDRLAMKSSPGSHGCFINPFITIEEINTSESLRESLIKQYEKSAPEDLTRALMEMVVFRLRSNIEKLSENGITAKRIVMVGGPSESPLWPQITADITGLKLSLINGQSAGAFGAAIMAGIGAGYFNDESEAFQKMKGRSIMIEPSLKVKEYDLYYQEYLNRFEKETGAE